jgi:hypothetical protein
VGRLAPLALLAPLAILAFVGAEPIHAQGAEPRRRDDALRYHDATLARMPPGPALYLADSDHALFPALYERIVAGARPDVAVASAGLMTSSWFLAMVDREVPELFVPYVDDSGRSDDLAGRLVAENLAAGRPVGGEDFALPGGGVPLGRGYLAGTATPPFEAPSAPPVYEGYLGRRVARRVGLQRAEWELAHGRPLEAARAAGVLDRLDAEMRAGLADAKRPPLAPLLPRVTPIFISAPWQLEILVDDLAQMAGRPPGPPPDGPLERRLLHVWVELLAGKDEARRRLDPLGIEARLATARMFDKLGRPADAAGQLEAVLVDDPRHEGALVLLGMLLANQGRLSDAEARVRAATDAHPKSARPWATLGVILAKQGRMPEAVAAWRRSLELDPEQPDVRAWLASPTP